MSGGLGAGELRRLMEAVSAINVLDGPNRFAHTALQAAMHLVPCDFGAYNEVDGERSVVVFEPEDVTFDGDPSQALADLQHEHPVIRHMATTGDGSARAISDFLSADEFHALELYERGFSPFGLEDQIAIGMLSPAPLLIGLALNRSTRGFDERERQLLDLLRPHVVRAYRNTSLHAQATSHLRAARTALGSAELAVFTVAPDGRPDAVTEGATDWIDTFFDQHDGRLPGAVADWLATELRKVDDPDSATGASGLFRHEGQDRRLLLRLVATDDRPLIVATEGRRSVGADQFVALGLTEREASVLSHLVEGTSNPQIARELGISRSGVKRHLERIYQKLGVDNRTAAASYALETISFAPH